MLRYGAEIEGLPKNVHTYSDKLTPPDYERMAEVTGWTLHPSPDPKKAPPLLVDTTVKLVFAQSLDGAIRPGVRIKRDGAEEDEVWDNPKVEIKPEGVIFTSTNHPTFLDRLVIEAEEDGKPGKAEMLPHPTHSNPVPPLETPIH